MKKILYGALFIVAQVIAHSIVLVHIGDTVPEYVNDCLQQIRLFNSCDVYLVSNAVALQKFEASLQLYSVVGVSCESLIKSEEHKKFCLNGRLSNGFWRFTTERFFYLEELVRQFNLKDVFHMEYDNMLYVDLSTLMSIFEENYPHAAATFDNDQRCIPGFLYFKDVVCLGELVKFLSQPSLCDKNDMQSLALFRDSKSEFIDFLPILSKRYTKEHELVSPSGHKVKQSSNYYKNINYFDSIFDAAALGQYLGGIDPRNGPIKPGFINESCVFNPSLLLFSWVDDDQGRKVPFVTFKDKKYRINNLHIHSKELHKFLS